MSDVDTASARREPGTDGPRLVATGIGKSYQGIAALTDVSVAVDIGELVALIGPNGAGKSTLFDCMSGVQTPDQGRVQFDGRDLHGMAQYQRSRLGLARTFQRIDPRPTSGPAATWCSSSSGSWTTPSDPPRPSASAAAGSSSWAVR